jgi:hypothetical protein
MTVDRSSLPTPHTVCPASAVAFLAECITGRQRDDRTLAVTTPLTHSSQTTGSMSFDDTWLNLTGSFVSKSDLNQGNMTSNAVANGYVLTALLVVFIIAALVNIAVRYFRRRNRAD